MFTFYSFFSEDFEFSLPTEGLLEASEDEDLLVEHPQLIFFLLNILY